MAAESPSEGKRPYGILYRDRLSDALALGSLEGAVYALLTTFADRNGGSIWPSQTTLAALAHKSRRAIVLAVHRLHGAGLIARAGFGPRGVVKWRLAPGEQPGAHVGNGLPTCAESGMPVAQPSAQVGEKPSAHDHSPLTRPETDHLPRPRVDSPLAAPREKAQDRPTASRQEAAPPPAGERKDTTDGLRTRTASQLSEQQEREGQAIRILDEGMLREMPAAYRLTAAKDAVAAYRRRWPHSWPTDWIAFADFPQLSGIVKDRPAWIWSHIVGYGSGDWTPENRDGSVRLWHDALLHGQIEQAIKLAALENSYSPEREAAKHREPSQPKRRGGTTIHKIGDALDQEDPPADSRPAQGAA